VFLILYIYINLLNLYIFYQNLAILVSILYNILYLYYKIIISILNIHIMNSIEYTYYEFNRIDNSYSFILLNIYTNNNSNQAHIYINLPCYNFRLYLMISLCRAVCKNLILIHHLYIYYINYIINKWLHIEYVFNRMLKSIFNIYILIFIYKIVIYLVALYFIDQKTCPFYRT
jgi:hypothetical protein